MTTVCLCIVAFAAVVFFAYMIHMSVFSRLDRLEREMTEINPVTIGFLGERQTIVDRVKKLEKDVKELERFYYFPSGSENKSLVDMIKELEERVDDNFLVTEERITNVIDNYEKIMEKSNGKNE